MMSIPRENILLSSFLSSIVKIVKRVGLDVTKVGLGMTKKAFPVGSSVGISRMSRHVPDKFS